MLSEGAEVSAHRPAHLDHGTYLGLVWKGQGKICVGRVPGKLRETEIFHMEAIKVEADDQWGFFINKIGNELSILLNWSENEKNTHKLFIKETET